MNYRASIRSDWRIMISATPHVRATEIGEFIRHHACERRFKLAFNEYELADELPFFYQLRSPMDPVLQEAGRRREQEWEACVRNAGLVDLCRYEERPEERETPWEVFAERAAALPVGVNAFGREIAVTGEIGAFVVSGRIDFVLLLWDGERLRLRLVECKASRKDQTYHRIQLVLYRILLRRLLAAHPLSIGGVPVTADMIECVVARIDETTDAVHDVLALAPLDLQIEEEDVVRLLAEGGPLHRVLRTELDVLPYQLGPQCDDCALHVHCLPESARQRRLELLGVDPTTVRALHAAGIRTLDDLAALDLSSPIASAVRADSGFSGNLHLLVHRARARRRTLPGGEANGNDHEVIAIPFAGNGQLPEHVQGGQRLVRIFLSVHYDYVENRIGAVAAHVTRSDRPLSTLFRQRDGRWEPDPDVKEQWSTGKDPCGRTLFADRPVRGVDVVRIVPEPWTGDYAQDTGREAELLHRFFRELVAAVQAVCPEERAPLHFYAWSRGELSRLVEACSRCDTELLGHLRELLGCRESLEQLIYSCLQDEVHSRYALGWTGQGLLVATSLRWFGRRFHWTRRVGDTVVPLDRVFLQDHFDFTTALRYDGAAPGRPWRTLDDPEAQRLRFEVRACFGDALPAPYWRARWGTLPDPDEPTPGERRDPKQEAALRRYREAGQPGHLEAYLQARVQALRWIEESVTYKNGDIVKPPVRIADLSRFNLGVDSAARAALDFLWLEQHVKVRDWIAGRLVPPLQRVTEGQTIPLRGVYREEDGTLVGRIDLSGYPIDRAGLETRCSFGEGSFVRLTPCAADPSRGQTVAQLLRAGSTCTIARLDWETGEVRLSVVPARGNDRYLLRSIAWREDWDGFPAATLDESPSDFVGGRVDRRLQCSLGTHAYRWFDPVQPVLPPLEELHAETMARCREFIQTLPLEYGTLAEDQVRAAVEGLNARVQLLQGPPGTGKTQTTAAATLLRILARVRPGDTVLLAGNTHMAVDTLLHRLVHVLPRFCEHAAAHGFQVPRVRLARVHSSAPETPSGCGIADLPAGSCATRVSELLDGGVAVLAGTPSALLKLTEHLGERMPWSEHPQRFQAALLVVDEASMLVQPYFLALASLVDETGSILLAGDHRQLAPIVSHDWEHEDRPPAVTYQPFHSAYVAVQQLKQNRGFTDDQVLRSALSFTFRLPPAIRELICRLYRQDGIELDGHPADATEQVREATGGWERLWTGVGMFLVTHDERQSKQSNPVEAEIIREILAAGARLGQLAPASVGIVMPHRAQRSLLKTRLAEFAAAADVMDTVERLQGGERETVIVSATCSDPTAISAQAEFILNLNRANVAFSRAKRRLIVVCAESLLSHIPAELEHYEAAVLWKSLRTLCRSTATKVRTRECFAQFSEAAVVSNEVRGSRD